MIVIEIHVNNARYGNSWSMETFAKSIFSNTSLGRLLIDLAAETTWSGAYNIHAEFPVYGKNKPSLKITHPSFLHESPLMIDEASGFISVRDVEDALRKYFRIAQKKIEAQISPLQVKGQDLYDALCNIDICKAKAFASRELQIPEYQLQRGHVTSEVRPQETGTSVESYDPYIVEQVVLETLDGPYMVVKFGPDNLPAKVTPVPRPQTA